jgi:HAD domain in Swiss Army Knife RNA repair proteins
MTLVFLDFDGVMHPVGCDPERHFCQRDLFEEVMREHPDVRIVISSTWRQAYPMAELKRLFSPDIAQRIIGKTPTHEDESEEHIRYREIGQVLQNPKVAGARWIAIDDSDFEFPDGCPNLLLCSGERGFDAEASRQLRARLSAS